VLTHDNRVVHDQLDARPEADRTPSTRDNRRRQAGGGRHQHVRFTAIRMPTSNALGNVRSVVNVDQSIPTGHTAQGNGSAGDERTTTQ